MKKIEKIEESAFTKEEEAYRRGYSQGFIAARRNPELDWNEVYAWRHGNQDTCPPGSQMEGVYLKGLRENCKEDFFINKLEKIGM